MRFYPTQDLGVVVMGNVTGYQSEKIAEGLISATMNQWYPFYFQFDIVSRKALPASLAGLFHCGQTESSHSLFHLHRPTNSNSFCYILIWS